MTEENEITQDDIIQAKDIKHNELVNLAKNVVFNPTRSIEERYKGLMILLNDAIAKRDKLNHGIRKMEAYLSSAIYIKALEEHKKKRIFEFTQKWAGKEVNEQMALEMQALEKPNHCYTFSGIKVIELDCNLCKSRKCKAGDTDYIPNQFEELLGGYTEDMPEGTHSIDSSMQSDDEPESEVDNELE